MTPLVLFVDTEFTDFKDPKPISIGIAASTGEEFYAEIVYPIGECSEFVTANVLPLLRKTSPFSLDEVAVVICAWIDEVKNGKPAIVAYDSHFDKDILDQIFKANPPSGVVFRALNPSYIDKLKMNDWHLKTMQAAHHALHDARALRYAFRGWIRQIR